MELGGGLNNDLCHVCFKYHITRVPCSKYIRFYMTSYPIYYTGQWLLYSKRAFSCTTMFSC